MREGEWGGSKGTSGIYTIHAKLFNSVLSKRFSKISFIYQKKKKMGFDKKVLKIQMKFYWIQKRFRKKKLGIRLRFYWIQIRIQEKTVGF